MFIALLLATAPVEIASKDELLEFSFSWSAEAAAVPQIDRSFRADAAVAKREALATARADRGARSKMGAGWNGHYFVRKWTTAGQNSRLLSLEAETGTFTGGAHGSNGTTALLWDRQQSRKVIVDSLLQRSGWWNGAIRQPFCTLLDRERTTRRGEPVVRTEPFGACPDLKDLTLALTDVDADRRFDHVKITADQYVAGPYAEGEYVVSLPVTAAMLARVKPEYRSSFEAQPPVQ